MNVLPISRGKPATVTERRWRTAALLGLVIFLALTVFAAVAIGGRSNPVSAVTVLRATRDIRPGTTITGDELATAQVRIDDPALLSTLVQSSDRSRLIGQVAAVGVSSGHLVPDNVIAPQVTAGLWEVNLPVKRMPTDLQAGDHVALVVTGASGSGSPVEFVVMQDVQVISIGSGSADLWLPPKLVAQMNFYSDHGGIVLVKMQPGAIQQNLAPGTGS
ncbi:MAG: CpaB family protein [Candidatus Dormibacteria bacterium]